MSTRENKLHVADVMMSLDRLPVVDEHAMFKEALELMSKRQLGIVCIVSNTSKLMGVLTDGDIRRMLLRVQKPFSAIFAEDVIDHAVRTPVTVNPSSKLTEAIKLMEEKHVWDLPVVDDGGTLLGLLHLHPAVEMLLGLKS